MRLSYRLSAMITALCMFTGCAMGSGGDGALSQMLQNNEVAPVSMTSYTKSDYKVFVNEEGAPPSELEPENGCYLGSYVLSNSQINYDMEQFDLAAGKKHALSVYNTRLGEDFPYDWVLECTANMKTPYIIMKPANEYDVFREDLLAQTAAKYAEISVPIFVDFYPNPQNYTRNAEKYVEFYKKASAAFSSHAPNVIMVISADSKNVYDFDLFYPGGEYVDWIGIMLYRPLYVNGEVNLRNYMKDLDYFYAMFQREKPLLVSQLAFSSYSTVDHRYASQESAKRLVEFYDILKTEYTRIKAVNYMDFNNIDGAPKKAERDNFSVTQDSKMLEAYRSAIEDSYFLSSTNKSKSVTMIDKYRSYYPVYEDENYKYVSRNTLDSEILSKPDLQSVVINGEPHCSTGELSAVYKVAIDKERKQIIIDAL